MSTSVEDGDFEQLVLALPKPKARKKPGPKPSGKRRDPRHRERPAHSRHHPVHVVLRVRKDVPRLRKARAFQAIRAALRAMGARVGFRVVHASIQHNHFHFLIEAEDRRALSRGVQALAISLARRINKAYGRKGKLFAYRFHATAITSPRQARNALAYVLNNWRHHREDLANPIARASALDPYATGVAFDGWREASAWRVPDGYEPLPVTSPETWLLRIGWRRAGPALGVYAVPSGR
jgi:REP element-mobilizing transposase RayT